jgi:hypothetical protein
MPRRENRVHLNGLVTALISFGCQGGGDAGVLCVLESKNSPASCTETN